MRLYDEIFSRSDGVFPSARCLLAIDGEGYFQGVKSLGDFSPDRVEIYFGNKAIAVEGETLCVKKYCDGDLVLGGKIKAFSLLNGGR